MRRVSTLCCAFAALASNPASAISTYKDWDKKAYFSDMGCGGSPTYGEIFIVPDGKHYLDKFTFSLANVPGEPLFSSMVVRAEVYEWDGEKAAGSGLYESEPMTISYNDEELNRVFHKVTFKPAALHLKPGGVYVFFVTTSKDHCFGYYVTDWGGIYPGDPYGGGKMVVFNGTNPADWTTTPWLDFGPRDIAFRADFNP